MIRHHVRSFGNNKIMAIKLVRELTGLGLKEAKDAVEQQIGFAVTADAASQARISEEAARYQIEFDPPLDGTIAATSGSTSQWGGSDGCSIRFVSGTQLIMAIKLVRELTGLGLKESKDLVDRGGIMRTELSRAEAEAIVRQFEEIGAQVQVIEPGSSARGRFVHDYEKEDDYDF